MFCPKHHYFLPSYSTVRKWYKQHRCYNDLWDDQRSLLADLLEERHSGSGRVILSLLAPHPELLLLHLHTQREDWNLVLICHGLNWFTSAITLSLPPSPPRWPYEQTWTTQACWRIPRWRWVWDNHSHLHTHGLEVSPAALRLPPAPKSKQLLKTFHYQVHLSSWQASMSGSIIISPPLRLQLLKLLTCAKNEFLHRGD